MEKITGIILAGGKSLRMKQNKALLEWKNKTFIEHIFLTLQKVCDEIIISANTSEYNFLKTKIVKDMYQNTGAIGGIFSALTESENEKNLIISCDTPLVSEDVFKYLINNHKKEIAICSENKKIQPLIGIYHKKNIFKIEQEILKKNYKLMCILKKFDVQILEMNELDFYHQDLFLNINTTIDFQHFLESHQ